MSLRIVFMGTPEFAVPSLAALIHQSHSVVAVITQPDRKKGRGERLTQCEVKCLALQNNIPVMQPTKIKKPEWIEKIKALKPDLFVTCAYGQILSKELLDIPKQGCINVHASLLPKYRGAAPIQHAIINGEKKTGITTMMTDIGMDTGDILLQEEVAISDDMDSGQLHDVLKHLGAKVLIKTLQKLEESTLKAIPQDNEKASYAPMLKKQDGRICWGKNAKEIHDQVRGLNPWPGCFTYYKGSKMKIFKTSYCMDDHPGKPGEILTIDKNHMMVKCETGILYIYEMQFENRCKMNIEQCGHNLETGVFLKD